MRELWLYDAIDRMGLRNYRAKVMTVAFLGTHVPLLALIGFVALRSFSDWDQFLRTLAIALVATLIGSGATLFVLHHLLRPARMTGDALRAFRQRRLIAPLPTHYRDEVGRLMADASETIEHLDRALDSLEFSDPRTQLPNRKRLARDIARDLETGAQFAVVAIRFADHARLAQTLSLDAAEQAAAAVAVRLRNELRDDARLYRIDPCDFVVLSPLAEDSQMIRATLQRRLEACSAPLELAAIAIKPVLRAGIALAPADASDAEVLIDYALAAAPQSAEMGNVGFHSPAARAAACERLQIEQDMRRALAENEFVFHYQPVIDLQSHQVVAAEALVRWRHPELGLLFPGKFIDVAEASGLIEPIGLWGLQAACQQVKAWRGVEFAPRRIAVNLSARQFLDADLVAHVRRAIGEAGVSPDSLEIELTETAAMADHDYTRRAFAKLRDLGVSIAIDDFGAGFASLSYLRKLPFDKLKIDREFVTNVHRLRESQAICRALLALGDGLGLEVLAEGTETAEEVAYLGSVGCSLYQGYYFAKPVPAEEFVSACQKASLASAALAMRQSDAGLTVSPAARSA